MENNIKLELQKEHFSLIISDKLERKIRVLCNKFPNLEWSGHLFYTYKGSFKNGNIVFTAEDLLFMDTGGATETEFDLSDGNSAEYIVNHELWDCQIGLIHSHNQLQAFFSGQDDAMLRQEGTSRNHFLSLVVNNAGQYVARVTVKEERSEKVSRKTNYKSFNNIEVNKKGTSYKLNYSVICLYDLDIKKNNNQMCDDYDELMNIIEECNKRKQEKAEAKVKSATPIADYFPNYSKLLSFNKIPSTSNIPKKGKVLSQDKLDYFTTPIISLNLNNHSHLTQENCDKVAKSIKGIVESSDLYSNYVEAIIDILIYKELVDYIDSQYAPSISDDMYNKAVEEIVDYLTQFDSGDCNKIIDTIVSYIMI